MDADGAGGKGTWGKLLDTDVDSHIDRNDPNYDSGEVKSFSWFCCKFPIPIAVITHPNLAA